MKYTFSFIFLSVAVYFLHPFVLTIDKKDGKGRSFDPWQKALREQLGIPEYETVDPNKPLFEQVAIIEIGNRTFAIPKVFIQSNLKGKKKVTGLNLLYVMPNFTSRARFKNDEEYRKAFNERRMAGMLIKDLAVSTPIEQIIHNRQRGGRMTKHEGKEYGLEKYIDFDDPRHLNIRYRDTYLETNHHNEINGYIECTPDGEARFPGCSDYFDDKGIRYSIYYNKSKFLATWPEHRKKAIKFIDSFEITNQLSVEREKP